MDIIYIGCGLADKKQWLVKTAGQCGCRESCMVLHDVYIAWVSGGMVCTCCAQGSVYISSMHASHGHNYNRQALWSTLTVNPV